MIQGRSYYYPGGQGTEVSGIGGGDAMNYLQALMQREAQAASQPRMAASRNPMGASESRRPASPPEGAYWGRDPRTSIKTNMDHLRDRDEIMQMQAAQQPAPMRMVTGPGVTPGYVMDPNAMNAYQRELYLPKNSTREFTPDEVARSGVDSKAYEAWLALMNAQRASTQTTNLPPERNAQQQRNNAYYGR